MGNSAIAARSRGGGRPVVPLLEQVQGLALAFLQHLVDPLGDAHRLVVVADLGLVVPEHGQPAVAAQAVQAELEDLAAAAAGDDDGLPGVPQAAVERVVVSGQGLQVGLVGQRPGDLVGERGARPLDHPAGGGHRGDEAPVQAEPVGLAGLQCPAQQPPGAVEDGLPGVGGHDRRLAVNAPGSQRGQPVELALPLVGGELVHVLRGRAPGGRGRRRGRASSRKALSSSPARRVSSKVLPERGQHGDRRTSAKWSQTRSRSHRWEMPDRSMRPGRLLSFRPKCPVRM